MAMAPGLDVSRPEPYNTAPNLADPGLQPGLQISVGRDITMARRCDITGKGIQSGNHVSHAHNKTRRRYLPNVHKMTLFSDTLGPVSLKISAHALRSIEHNGGLDAFLLGRADSKLAPTGLRLKRRIKRAQEKAAAKAA